MWHSDGDSGGDSLCKGGSCNSCRNAVAKVVVVGYWWWRSADGGGGNSSVRVAVVIVVGIL